MKRLIDFSTIALSLLLLSTSGVKALDSTVKPEAKQFLNLSTLIAQTQTESQFVTVEKDHATSGTVSIIEKDGKQFIQIEDNFKTAEGPDVEIILHKNSAIPLNIKEENYITIAPIQSFSGSQIYEIPKGVDLNDYGAVGVWCQEFNITFGYAQL